MLKIKLLVVLLGMVLFMAIPAFADGHGPYYGGHSYHGAYYGGHGHHGYAPQVYRPRVVYPAPYVVYPRPVYRPACPVYDYYGTPSSSFYIQGRNFSFGVGF
jgi:hypothetical protein